MDLQAIDVSLV